jgi:hypothetical protein
MVGDLSISDVDSEIVSCIEGLTFFQRINNLGSRRLILTKEGRFGFTIRGVKLNDVVCVFNGAPVAHVIRNVEDRTDRTETWHCVGDAYVHGLMYGEADGIETEEKDVMLV